MNGRRAIVGLCLLCAMAFSAIAAQSAVAAKGTTLFTCTEAAETKTFGSGDCNTAGAKFGHVEVPQGVTTHVALKNTSVVKLKTTIGGTAVTLETNTMTGTGSVKNVLSGKEHWIQGSEIKLKGSGVTVSPISCGVSGVPGGAGVIETKALKGTTQTELMAIKLEAESGTTLAEWEWTGATCPFTGIAKLVGSISCVPSGAELVCSHEEMTASKTLRNGSAAGPVTGMEGRVTITGGEGTAAEGKATNPLSATTKETA